MGLRLPPAKKVAPHGLSGPCTAVSVWPYRYAQRAAYRYPAGHRPVADPDPLPRGGHLKHLTTNRHARTDRVPGWSTLADRLPAGMSVDNSMGLRLPPAKKVAVHGIQGRAARHLLAPYRYAYRSAYRYPLPDFDPKGYRRCSAIPTCRPLTRLCGTPCRACPFRRRCAPLARPSPHRYRRRLRSWSAGPRCPPHTNAPTTSRPGAGASHPHPRHALRWPPRGFAARPAASARTAFHRRSPPGRAGVIDSP